MRVRIGVAGPGDCSPEIYWAAEGEYLKDPMLQDALLVSGRPGE